MLSDLCFKFFETQPFSNITHVCDNYDRIPIIIFIVMLIFEGTCGGEKEYRPTKKDSWEV